MTGDEKDAVKWTVEFFVGEFIGNIRGTLAIAGFPEECANTALELAAEYVANWDNPAYQEAVRATCMDAIAKGLK